MLPQPGASSQQAGDDVFDLQGLPLVLFKHWLLHCSLLKLMQC
jgi:hypothetical protein